MPRRLQFPVICLVTDRRRIFGRDDSRATDALVAQVAGAARAGVDLIQIRERDLDGGALLALTVRCLRAVADTRAVVVVNDRLDVALAAGAHGVHLRGASIPAARARALAGEGFLVGRSVHAEGEARDVARAGGADYLIAGAVFESASKREGHATMGLDAFGRLVRLIDVPVLAIGGITADRVPDVMAAGGAGIAAIGLFLGTEGDDPGRAAAAGVRRVRAALAAGTRRSDTLGFDR